MEVVGSGFRNGVHHSAGELSVFGVEGIGDQPEFGYRVQIRHQPGAHVSALVDIAAIHEKSVRILALAADGHVAGFVKETGGWPDSRYGARRDRHHASLQSEQVEVAAAVQGK